MTSTYLEIPFSVKAADINEDGTFSGWGSLFDDKPDAHRDIVSRGAFAESLAAGGRNKTGIAMLWQHRTDKMPPGVWLELREDPKGLYAKGQLALDTQMGKEAYSIMALGAKTGMWRFSLSIGYDTIMSERKKIKVGDAEVEIRDLKKVDLWEISIVNFPAKVGATIIDVKQIDIEAIKLIDNERDLETFLRESGRFSKNAAIHVVSWWKSFRREADNEQKCVLAEDEAAIILDSLSQANKSLKEFYEINSIRESFSAFDF